MSFYAEKEQQLEGVAIVGMAGRFPGARDLQTFWQNLIEGKDNITRFGAGSIEARTKTATGEDYVAARGVLEEVGMFDAEYFGVSPKEAEQMDPQHRVFLETCVQALEDGGYGDAGAKVEIGLFAGCSLNTYLLANLASGREFLDELTAQYQVGEFAAALGNDKDFLTTRAAYKLNLRGPVVSVQSACATSLVAICQAAQALMNYQCEMALAGGVSATFPQHRGHVYSDGGIVSADGHCRPFDANATGTVFGHGVGVVLLKRMEDAVRDGDQIYAVLRGFAVNNDGSAKAGYMAPGIEGQARVIAAAQAMAGVMPDEISYVEAHGTGTPLGDPIEIAALTKVFADSGTSHCAIGTAKANVGHLDAAAGVTGLIKTALSLRAKTLPGLLHFQSLNPNIAAADSPFRFTAKTTPWTAEGVRRAGVSAFGVGGVNAHVVLQEAPARVTGSSLRARQVFCVSGRTETAALAAAEQLAFYCKAHPEIDPADVAFTLAVGRKQHSFRAAAALEAGASWPLPPRIIKAAKHKIAFQFSGQGTQCIGMGRDLYDAEPTYRTIIDECAGYLDFDLRKLILAGSAEQLNQTEYVQPALFATELALAELWLSWGVAPGAMLGHSLGEYVAATVAGIFSRSDAMRLVALRGRLMGMLPAGAMLSVALGEGEALTYTSETVSLAAVNSERACVLSGTLDAVDAVEDRLTANGIASRRLRTSHAFHSAMMEPMLAEFEAAVSAVPRAAPRMRMVSSVTGKWMADAEATNAAYWTRQCRLPVRFAAALETVEAELLLEIGIGETLTTLALQQARKTTAIASMQRPGGRTVQDAVASLWASGAEIDWRKYYAGEQRGRVSLPTYPFERKLYWVDPPPPILPAKIQNESDEQENAMSALPAASLPPAAADRKALLRLEIAAEFAALSGIATTPEEATHEFLELGFDSLFLTQATAALSKKFKVKLTFRQLMESFSTIATLADHLDDVLPAEAFAPVAAARLLDVQPRQHEATLATTTTMQDMLASQLAALSTMFAQQVAELTAVASGTQAPMAKPVAPALPAPSPALKTSPEVRFGTIQPKAQHELDEIQGRYIRALVARYAAKTPESKRRTQAGRKHLADPRAVSGFRPQWKEMVYPLITERAHGARLWDVDGNEYIDIVNGYGCILFGHSPAFVVEAATAQLEKGVAIGPQSPLAAEVADLICELTGNERVTFCNTGSEAVMAAIRVARTVTGRDKIVYFAGDYHGTFDEVLVRATPRGTAPLAPGIPLDNVKNVVVLEYGAPASLDWIRSNADDLAAVLVEPVQTRNPGLQPADFMREIRTITQRTGSAMILDEVVTGFRLAPGGAQEFYGIRADLCTYGKVIGGGHPIGVLSGKHEYLDALDGGAWQFGDDSGPEVGVTFFAGTFVRHPLALAAAKAVLTHLKTAGPSLQKDLNAKTAALAERLDAFFQQRGVPTQIRHFASWFYFTFPHDAKLGSLFYYVMRAKGIHIQEGYPCFITTAHTDDDLAAVEAAFRETIFEMQAARVLPATEDSNLLPQHGELRKPSGMHEAALAEAPARVPLTEPQQEIFLAAALNEEANCAFNESLTLTLRGPLREDALRDALEKVFARHDGLRGTVSEEGAWLEIAAKPAFTAEFVDLRSVDEPPQRGMLSDAIDREGRTAFNLMDGPLVRATCFRMGDEETVLLLTAHHIVLDGWSANQLLEEIGAIYSGHELGALLPFSSYAVLEKQREAAGDFAANEAYWVELFSGRSPRLDLPVDRPRGLEKSYKGSTCSGRLDATLYAELKKASASVGCTLYVTLLGAFELLMHRLSGQSEVVVGISTAGQALYDEASLVGHAVHFLPMLSESEDSRTTREHLRATRSALLDAYDHQEFTYGSLIRKLKLEREPGRLPLIEVQFNLEKIGANVRFEGLSVEIRSVAKQFVNTDLFLNVVEDTTGLNFTCDYNTTLFDQSTLVRWMAGWEQLLRSLVAGLDAPVGTLDMLPPPERSLVLQAASQPHLDFGAFEPMAATFLRCAQQTPASIAIECGGRAWTYARLAQYVQGLAARLVAEGVEPGTLVGLCLDRSAEMVGAMLSVMLAGAAYVPMDPRHPVERLRMVVEDSGLNLILTSHTIDLGVRQLALEPSYPMAAQAFLQRSATDLAYVIYTSGSTGRPKGVAIEHGALTNLLRSMQQTPGLKPDDVWVAVTTPAFDIAALELLLPLMTGAKLVVATDAEVTDGPLLLALIERSRSAAGATVLQATPGAWRILIDAGWTAATRLKVLSGGEALPRELAEKLLERSQEVWNMYGPTETTIWSSATRVTHGAGPVRIGPPIANTQFYILNKHRNPCGFGVMGELYIGGAGLARGYWQRPELTAEKFTVNPFEPGRIYATGDLARLHVDGSFELLGRTDFQVKVRGYRIELAEIEAALMRYPSLREAVVVQAKNGRLAAYLSAQDEIGTTELPALLARTLPEYMVPSSFTVLEQLPRTANGKVDRKALPEAAAETLTREFLLASTPEQTLLAGIWSELLEVSQVSIAESVFELGADSLLIFRMAARAQREGLPVNATMIFQQRTIAAICAALETGKAAAPTKAAPRIAAAARDSYRLTKERADATIH